MQMLPLLRDKLLTAAPPPPCLLVGMRSIDGGPMAVDLVIAPEDEHSDDALALHHLLPWGLDYIGTWDADASGAARLMSKYESVLSAPHGSASKSVLLACGTGNELRVQVLPSVRAAAAGSALGAGAMPAFHNGAELGDTGGGDGGGSTDGVPAWLQSTGLRIVRVRAELSLAAHSHGGSDDGDAAAAGAALPCAFETLHAQLSGGDVVFALTCGGGGGSRALAAPSSAGALASVAGGDAGVLDATPLLLHAAAPAPRAPTFEYHAADPPPVAEARVAVTLDVLAYCRTDTPLAALAGVCLVPALRRQLNAFERAMARPGAVGAAGPARALWLRPWHLMPPGRSHHVCVLYPQLRPEDVANEAALAPYRRRLHSLLWLPMDRPALRVASALTWQAGDADAGGDGGGGGGGCDPQHRLQNVHDGVPLPGDARDCHLVQGAYDYHHYMQDRFDDAGWGCAYRSLQTLCSWFRRQQYTSKPSPGHREIQQILVKLGDKDKSFVGSSKWIGAIELSYILDDYLDVVSKIVTVNRGSDIPQHARELAEHFKRHGTPVMIGGGVLAYTLLGVYFNEQTGDCAFLILDPHYTGGEILSKIHKGTWVGWKRPGDQAAAGGPLFVNDAFYNFLCPERPNEV